MYRILKREQFGPATFLWEVEAHDVARAAQPGGCEGEGADRPYARGHDDEWQGSDQSGSQAHERRCDDHGT